MDIPAGWHQATDRILGEARPGLVVMVVGATDTGKTTFCRYLASRLAETEVSVGLVDADVGQSSIGPPAAISGGLIASPLHTGTLVEPTIGIFVGSISPVGHLLSCVAGTKRVAGRLGELGAGAIVVDTSGLVLGSAGRALKEHKFDLLQPQVVVAIQRDRELEHLVRLWQRSTALVMAVRPSPEAMLRTPTERRTYRGQRFAECFADAETITLPLGSVAWRGTRLGQGQVMSAGQMAALSEALGMRVLHGERQGDEAMLVTAGHLAWPANHMVASKLGVERVTVQEIRRYTGVLCGLLGRDGFLASMAVLHRLDFAAGVMEVIAPGSLQQDVGVIHVGRVKLDSRGRELGTLRPGDV